jgi:outer membrane immunogenic protein
MKRFLGSIIAILAFIGGPALAAGPAPFPAINWSGFYAGLNAGGAMVSGGFMDPCFTCADLTINAPAFIVGGQAGYNWQYRSFVYGVEGDIDWVSANRTLINAADDSDEAGTATLKMDAFASLRGRMGLAYENTLIYVTAGPAFGHFNSNVMLGTFPGTSDHDTSRDKVWLPGVAAGAGAEVMLSGNLSVRGELLYAMFTDSNTNYIVNATGLPQVCALGLTCGINYSNSTVIGRLGVNWKLN